MELALVMILCDNDFDKVDYFVIHARFIRFFICSFRCIELANNHLLGRNDFDYVDCKAIHARFIILNSIGCHYAKVIIIKQ